MSLENSAPQDDGMVNTDDASDHLAWQTAVMRPRLLLLVFVLTIAIPTKMLTVAAPTI